MRNFIPFFLFLIVLGLSGCTEKIELEYDQIQIKGADGSVALQIEPLAGQGYRLSACVDHLCGTLQEAGFHIEQSVNATTHHKTWRVPVQDISDFSTIVSTEELHARQVWAYAYVICDNIEVQSLPIELHLDTDVLPDPIPEVERIELGDLQGNGWEGQYFNVRVIGKNFVPFEKYDYQNPLFRTGYLRGNAREELKLFPLSATEEQLLVRLNLDRYCYDESFTWWQGKKSVVIEGIRIDAPNWLLPPSHSYRLGETFVPEFANEEDKNKIELYDAVGHKSYATSFIISPEYTDTYSFVQRYSHTPIHGHDITIPISYPWQLVEGKIGYTRIIRERVCSGNCVFFLEPNSTLHWFDGETQKEYEVSLPFSAYTEHIASSDDPTSVVIVNTVGMSDKQEIYRHQMISQKLQKLGTTPKDEGSIKLTYERDGVLYEVIKQGSTYRLAHVDLDHLRFSSEAIDLGVTGIDWFAGEYNGEIYYCSNYHQYAYDIASHTVRQLPDLPAKNSWSKYYTTISGHWLYSGDGPTVRFDLDQPDVTPEFLGCPVNGYSASWSYPMGDDCYMALVEYGSDGKKMHRLYRFVDDRK